LMLCLTISTFIMNKYLYGRLNTSLLTFCYFYDKIFHIHRFCLRSKRTSIIDYNNNLIQTVQTVYSWKCYHNIVIKLKHFFVYESIYSWLVLQSLHRVLLVCFFSLWVKQEPFAFPINITQNIKLFLWMELY
jgi:hypothetical protein